MVHGKPSTQHALLEDGISLLPDCLLVEIISRLPETKYAIRTCTLSKRWQHLWTQLPNLIIHRKSKYNIPQFYSSVERILSQLNSLNRFKLHALHTKETKSQLNNCIRDAINHNVQEVDFYLYPGSYNIIWFDLPEFFFISSSFIHLTLSYCKFKQVDVVSWENLRTLHIEDGRLDQDVIKNILSGSPLLETLELVFCCGFKRIDVTNKSVKNLTHIGYYNDMVKINAPYIVSLALKGYFYLPDLVKSMLNAPSVIKAELDYYFRGQSEEVHEEMLKGLILSLGHVKEVKIGKKCLKALTGLKAKGFTLPSNLKVLSENDSN